MALSGKVTTNKYSNRYYEVSWSATQDITTNQSEISYEIKAVGGSGYYAERALKVVIAGNTVIDKTDRVQRYAGSIKTGTVTVTHDNEGKKNFDITIEVACYTATVNLTGSGSFTLDNIPRAATLVKAPNFSDEDNPTITYSNALGNNVGALDACISFDGSKDDIPYRAVSKTGTTYTFNLTDTERNTLRNYANDSTVKTVYFFLRTVINGVTYHKALGASLTIVDCAPVLNPTALDIASISTSLTGDGNIVIKNYNVFEVATNAVAKKGATIVKEQIKCGSKEITSGSGKLYYVDDYKFIYTAIDSRGQQTTKILMKPYVNYIKPTCTIGAATPSATTNSINATISGTFFNGSFGSKQNTLKYQYKVKEDGSETDGEWSTAADISATGNSYEVTFTIPNLDYKKKYIIQARVADLIYSGGGEAMILTNEIAVKTQPVFDWGENDFAFNVPISIEGAPLNDFVIQQGTDSNGWYYRKWKNGKAECWKILTIKTKIDAAWGALYTGSTKMSRQSYPFSFSSKPVEIVTIQSGNSATWVIAESGGAGVNSSNTSAIYNLVRPTVLSSEGTFYLSMYVCGTL